MSKEPLLPDDPREWLNRARSNLLRAGLEVEGVYLEDLCFDAQQAAEKALKAILIYRSMKFPYVHDLVQFFTLIEESGQAVPESVKQAAKLTRFAVVTRYPGVEPVTREEYEEAVLLAEEIVSWAEEVIQFHATPAES